MMENGINKTCKLSLLLLSAMVATSLNGEVTVGFEDLPLAVPPLEAYAGPGAGAYYNGSDSAGGFESNGVFFENIFTDFGGGFTGWTGWAYSNTTDTETAGFGNQYSSYAGAAAAGQVYAVTFAPSMIGLPVGAKAPLSIAVSNTSYAAISMRDGDDFAKKFEEGDFFRLTLTGYDYTGQALGTVEVYLADFRSETVDKGILEGWEEISLADLSGGAAELVHRIGFALDSTDIGQFGMNTPSYVAIDQLVLGDSPTWGPYDLEADGWVDTGEYLGWVYVLEDFVYIEDLGKWTFLPESNLGSGTGTWVHVPK